MSGQTDSAVGGGLSAGTVPVDSSNLWHATELSESDYETIFRAFGFELPFDSPNVFERSKRSRHNFAGVQYGTSYMHGRIQQNWKMQLEQLVGDVPGMQTG